MFHGKIHYFYGHFQLLFVCLPEGKQPKISLIGHIPISQMRQMRPRCPEADPASIPEAMYSRCVSVQDFGGGWLPSNKLFVYIVYNYICINNIFCDVFIYIYICIV